MAILGAHRSMAGGYYRAVDAAADERMQCVQLFTKNNNQWAAKPIRDEDASRFTASLQQHGIEHPLSHSSYLINLASPDAALWKKSIDAFVVELRRADRLGIPYVVLHPGAYTSSSESRGIRRVARALNECFRQTRDLDAGCLLETTAGQGTNLGYRFEQLAAILDRIDQQQRVDICFDTCHVFAAGYPLETRKDYLATLRQFGKLIGIERIRAFHLNDSQKPLGSRRDRHAHIGKGCMGLEPFRHLLNDRRFRSVPMYLETPKGANGKRTWDAVNLRVLRRLAAKG